MRYILFLLYILPFTLNAQEFKRAVFEYDKLPIDTIRCQKDVEGKLEAAFMKLEQNESEEAVKIAKHIYDKTPNCPAVYDTYGYSLFRHGEWLEGVAIVDKGIQKFGRVPDLIKRRSEMSLEMAEHGTGKQTIDGNTIYYNNTIPYEEKQFIRENLRSALQDVEYLLQTYYRSEEMYRAAFIYQQLNEYNRSTEYFTKLIEDEDYGDNAVFNIANNYISQNKYNEAEASIRKLLVRNPRLPILFKKLSELCTLRGDSVSANTYQRQATFYQYTPQASNLDYTPENFELLVFFAENNPPAEKTKKLKTIAEGTNVSYTIDVCLMILFLHQNHGNDLEDQARDILAKIGKPTLVKVHDLFQSNISTCTVTYLADIMATVKDETSWQLLKDYLPYITSMPSTLIPPNVPQKLIKFDEARGLKEILTTVKPLLLQKSDSDDPMEELAGFGEYVFYLPLKDLKKSKVVQVAKELGYTKAELKALEDKMK